MLPWLGRLNINSFNQVWFYLTFIFQATSSQGQEILVGNNSPHNSSSNQGNKVICGTARILNKGATIMVNSLRIMEEILEDNNSSNHQLTIMVNKMSLVI